VPADGAKTGLAEDSLYIGRNMTDEVEIARSVRPPRVELQSRATDEYRLVTFLPVQTLEPGSQSGGSFRTLLHLEDLLDTHVYNLYVV
jgi:hypothetical protein